jgi:Cu+-exporting ATPase
MYSEVLTTVRDTLRLLPNTEKLKCFNFRRLRGKGILATINGVEVQIGSGTFVTTTAENDNLLTFILKLEANMWVDFFFTNQYREGLEFLFSSLNGNYQLKCWR